MSGRRRDARYGLSVPQAGLLTVAHPVVVERRVGRALYVLSETPERIGRTLALQRDAAGRDRMTVRLEECVAVSVEGRTKYRLRLAVLHG